MNNIQKKDGFKSEKIFVLPEFVYDNIAKHELIQDLFVSDIGYYPKAKYHFRERIEGADSHIFIYCSNGEGWVEINGKETIQIRKHTLIIIPAGVPHRYASVNSNPWSIYWFHLRGRHVMSFIHELTEKPLEFSLGFYVKFIELFEQCYSILTSKPFSLPHHIQVSQTMRYLLSTLRLTTIHPQQIDKREYYLDEAIQYMTEHLDSTISLSELAEYLNLSKQHIIHVFKQETGFSPIDYFRRLKMQRACQMLDLTNMSIKEISYSLGMNDQYYFSRSFKDIMGCSPTEYRKIQKG